VNTLTLWEVSRWFFLSAEVLFFVVVLVRYRKAFWGRLLGVILAVSVLESLWWRVIFRFERSFVRLPDTIEVIKPYFSALTLLLYALLVLAVTSAPLAVPRQRLPSLKAFDPRTPLGAAGTPRSVLKTVALLIVTINIYWVFWLHRIVKELNQVDTALIKATPGQAVGRLFIPLYNVYWFGYLWVVIPRAIAGLNERRPESPYHSSYSTPVITAFALSGPLLNAMAGWAHSIPLLIVGEGLFLALMGYTQRYLNRIWKAESVR
jgi:hypothetical protein